MMPPQSALSLKAMTSVVDPSLNFTFVSAVVSRPTADLAVVDAGSKAVDLVSGAPTLAVGSFRSGGDEHGIIDGPGDLACGDHVELFPSHCDPCVNLHDYWVCHRGGVVEAVVPVDARGPGL